MSGNNDNNKNYNDLTKKERENISAQKAGQTGARAAANVVTGGKYEKLRKIPGLGKIAKKQEDNVGKKVGNLDKATGGKVGRVAKPLNDSGAFDAANKGMDMMGGSKPSANNISSAQGTPNNNQTPGLNTKPNFAKNGINNENNIPNGNGEGANKSRLRDLFNKKKGIKERIGLGGNSDRKSLFNNRKKDKSNQEIGDQIVDVAGEGVKKLIKTALLPFIISFSILFFLALVVSSSSSDKSDLAAVDENDLNRKSTSAYSYGDPNRQKFYENVEKIRDEYKEKGKEINAMYITATYHIISRKIDNVKYEDITEDLIKEMAEGMLGGNSTYSKDTYTAYLKEKLLTRYKDIDSSEYDDVIEEIFEYIDQYMKEVYGDEKKSCTSTTGGSCTYTFNGVHGLNSESINLSNIQVKLMSSSDCPGGTDNVALNEPLIPFEEYVLGVGYGELGANYNYEVTKVHLIAARSFALTRPYYNRGAKGVKISKEGNQQILQIRSCVADQVFCNTKLGCSADYAISTQPMIYSGTTHQYVYQQPLSNYPNSNLEKAWKETMGMVGVDKDGKAVLMPYALNNTREDPQDPRVWVKWAESGKDYKAIILAAYPEIVQIKQTSCSETTESTENGFLKVAKEIWTEITNTFTAYTNGNQVPPTGKTIDCSSFVDWVLYKYGYEDFKGWQKVTQWFVTTDLHEKYGWEEIPVAAGEDVTSKLKPGDILVRDPGNNNGHMNIIVEVREDGSVWGYDCGDDSNWKSSKGGKVYNVSSFVKGDAWGGGRPGKIIRVTNQGTGDSCETAESGEWSEWRQNGTAPWRNIPLGKSSRTIGSHGCYVTSIAIQVARSGAKTTLNNFNPGTLVTELNKDPSSFDPNSGSFNNVGNMTKIVPGFKTIASNISIGRTKEEQIQTIQKYIDQGYYVILNVDYGGHWVAVTGTTKDGIQMVDPGRNNKNVYDAYSVSSCKGITVFDIK